MFSPSTMEIYDPLQKLILSKCERTWNNICQNIFNRARNIIKKNVAMAFYIKKKQLYLETDTLGVGLGASLLQVRNKNQFPRDESPNKEALKPRAFTSKSLRVQIPAMAT